MGEFFAWNADLYGLDVQDMDSEHQTLIKYMNRLHHLYETHAPMSEQASALETLATFTVKHFKDEEAYMATIGHAGLLAHSVIHKRLLDRLSTFATQFKRSGHLSDDFFTFLKMWLASHIRGIDAKYGKRQAVA